MSKRVTFRLTTEEHQKLLEVCESEVRGDLRESEMFRLLLHREWNRRKGLPAPQPKDYQASHRMGRPRKNV